MVVANLLLKRKRTTKTTDVHTKKRTTKKDDFLINEDIYDSEDSFNCSLASDLSEEDNVDSSSDSDEEEPTIEAELISLGVEPAKTTGKAKADQGNKKEKGEPVRPLRKKAKLDYKLAFPQFDSDDSDYDDPPPANPSKGGAPKPKGRPPKPKPTKPKKNKPALDLRPDLYEDDEDPNDYFCNNPARFGYKKGGKLAKGWKWNAETKQYEDVSEEAEKGKAAAVEPQIKVEEDE